MFSRSPNYLRFLAIFTLVALVCAAAESLHAESGAARIRNRIENVVRNHVHKGFQKANLKGEVVAIHLPSFVVGFDTDVKIRTIRTFTPSTAAGRYVIPLEIDHDGGAPEKINVTVESMAVVEGWAARFPLKRGDLIETEQFERKDIKVTRREHEFFNWDSIPSGYQLSTNLAQGQLLQFHHLDEVPAVRQGQEVMIHFQRNSVTLISPGKTRGEGKIGDMIPVVASVTGKRLYGRLVAPGILIVE
jgi:flagella basal body P-ring formation protein FlgA